MIYAIRALGTNYIKFGYTNNVAKRLSTMQTGCPVDLMLLASCSGDRKTEAWLHLRLLRAKAFQRGEWFNDCEEARQIIEEMKQHALKPELVSSADMALTQRHHRLGAVLALSQRKSRQWGIRRTRYDREHSVS
jgi:hypothetical protein